ncbi:uncharacterized protein [Choristoneura fumiferana]|uniref:uncharacterized protein n=1 Tax=Choristoneura fumiferana TaxID=7141 RepID=UPI003D1585E5
MSSQQLIANELLAFIQNAIDTMDEVSIVQICKSNFKEDEICSGKALLFQTLGKADQMPSRRRDGGIKSLQDIITMFKATDPDEVPSFVAKELRKLPPVTFDHVDVTTLLKDIVTLKANLAELSRKFDVSQDTITELRKEITTLRNSAPVTRSHVDALNSNVNNRLEADDDSAASSFESKRPPVQRERPEPRVPPAAPPPARPPRGPQHSANKQPAGRGYADAAGRAAAPRQPPAPPKATEPRATSTPNRPLSTKVDEEGFILVQKKSKARKKPCKSLCGSAEPDPGSGLRAATPNTALYVSRLHHTVAVADVVEYVRRKSGYTLRRHTGFEVAIRDKSGDEKHRATGQWNSIIINNMITRHLLHMTWK